jgi:hypothetical protein
MWCTKTSDSRCGGFAGESVEVDAIPSATLRDIVRDAIEEHVDHAQLEILRAAERSEREVLTNMAGHVERGQLFTYRPEV